MSISLAELQCFPAKATTVELPQVQIPLARVNGARVEIGVGQSCYMVGQHPSKILRFLDASAFTSNI